MPLCKQTNKQEKHLPCLSLRAWKLCSYLKHFSRTKTNNCQNDISGRISCYYHPTNATRHKKTCLLTTWNLTRIMKKMFDFSGTIIDDELACKTAKKTDHTPLEKHVVIVLHVEHTPSTWRVFTSTFQNLILHTQKTSCSRPAGIMYAWLNFSIFDKVKKTSTCFPITLLLNNRAKNANAVLKFQRNKGWKQILFLFSKQFFAQNLKIKNLLPEISIHILKAQPTFTHFDSLAFSTCPIGWKAWIVKALSTFSSVDPILILHFSPNGLVLGFLMQP